MTLRISKIYKTAWLVRRMATTDTKDEYQDFLSRNRVSSANMSQLTKLYNELESNMSSFDDKDYVLHCTTS